MALSIKEQIWNELINRLNGISYVNDVIEGARQLNLNGKFPCMYLDINPSTEQWESMPKRRSQWMIVSISAQIDIRGRLDKQIVGDTKRPGILRFEEDILDAIEGSSFRFPDSSGDPNVQSYEVEVTDNKNINNDIREVIIQVAFKSKIFTSGSRT